MTHQWMEQVRAGLDATPYSSSSAFVDPVQSFRDDYYVANKPLVMSLRWPAHNLWSVDRLRAMIGDETKVEVQVDRASDPLFEINSHAHKCRVKFRDFVRALDRGPDNDVYMTAQNAAANTSALAGLWNEVGPLPVWLRNDPREGFFWLGRDTTTALHHDETNNLLCQVFGIRHIRMFPHDQIDKLDYWRGVHTRINWVTDEMIAERGLVHQDIILLPGQALFIPIGWWHCVRTTGMSCMISYTNFVFPNFWGRVEG